MTVTMELANGEIRVVKETDEDGDGETTVRVEGLNLPSNWVGCERRA